MPARLEIPNLSLHYLVEELKPVVQGSVVEKMQELPGKGLKWRLHTQEGGKDLVLLDNFLFLSSLKLPARMQSSGFAAYFNKYASPKKILAFAQHGLDRLLVVSFPGHRLVFEMFGNPSLYLLDAEGKILSMHPPSARAGTKKAGQEYALPSSSLQSLPFGGFMESLAGEEPVGKTLARLGLGPVFAEETCARASVEKNRPASALSEEEKKKLWDSFRALFFPPTPPVLSPCLVSGKKTFLLLPFPLSSQPAPLTLFPSFSEALSFWIEHQDSLAPPQETSKKEQALAELAHSIAEQRKGLAAWREKEEEARKKGELVYAHFSELSLLQRELLEAIEKKKEKEGTRAHGFGIKKLDKQKMEAELEFLQ